jgi:two-component system, cell cycle sensor histidine kinase and response regulator CckA
MLSDLFNTSDFFPRWNCGNWTPFHGWTHIVADASIWAAYTAIPIVLLYFLYRRKDVPFPPVFWLFVLFILSCGIGHLVEASIFWLPIYRISAVVKVMTAVVSWATVIALVGVLPKALTLPGLARLNEQLRAEIAVREKREAELEAAILALRASERQVTSGAAELETVLEAVPAIVWIAEDVECRTIRGNRAARQATRLPTGVNHSLTASEEERPRNFYVAQKGRRLPADELPVQKAAATGQPISGTEIAMVFEDGSECHLLGNVMPLRDPDGRVSGAVAAFLDITEQKKLEAEREQMNRRMQESQKLESLGVLAGGIAHDFNNLLTGVLGNTNLAQMSAQPGSPLQPYLEQIESSAVRAADLCKQMLAYAGKGRFIVERLDLNRVIEETLHLLQISISKTAVLRYDLAETPLPIEADATQIRQIIMNLVINASDAIDKKSGFISIRTGLVRADRRYLTEAALSPDLPEGEYVHLEVSDTGCGIAPDVIGKIFDPFFSTKFTGRGLGLAAVQGIVRSHRGAIKVYSEPGRGTTFRVLFPSADRGVPLAAPKSAVIPKLEGEGLILIIDDEETVRAITARMVESLGFRVATAANGRDGLAEFEKRRDEIRLIILDLTMPHLDGEETFRALRAIDPKVKVVLVSGFNEQETTARFVGRGLAGFMQKPFKLATMARVLGKALG